MTLRIGLIGAKGKMGQRISDCVLNDPALSLVWELSSNSSRGLLRPVDVMIDFSTLSALKENLLLARETKTPIVIGTTGFGKTEHELLEKTSSEIPIFWAANFSFGMTLLIHALKTLSPLLQKKFTPHIKETHHIHKKDSPSGSALAIQASITNEGAAPPSIEAVRLGDTIGEHSVSFLAKDEKITFTHESLSRDVFALGALKAAQFLIHKPPKLYSMNDLLVGRF